MTNNDACYGCLLQDIDVDRISANMTTQAMWKAHMQQFKLFAHSVVQFAKRIPGIVLWSQYFYCDKVYLD